MLRKKHIFKFLLVSSGWLLSHCSVSIKETACTKQIKYPFMFEDIEPSFAISCTTVSVVTSVELLWYYLDRNRQQLMRNIVAVYSRKSWIWYLTTGQISPFISNRKVKSDLGSRWIQQMVCDAVQSHARALWSSFNLVVRAVSLKIGDEHLLSQENILPKSPRIWLYTLVALLSFKAGALTVFPSMLEVCSISPHGGEMDNLPHCLCGGKSHCSWAVAVSLGFQRNRVEKCETFLHDWTCVSYSTIPHQRQKKTLEILQSK